MGRNKKPTNLRLLQGNPGRVKINENEPKPAVCIPEPPEFLEGLALDEWHRMGKILFFNGILTEMDVAAFAGYCINYARIAEAERHIREEGGVITTSNGNLIQSPWVGISNTAQKQMNTFLTAFGMSPVSRSRVTAQAKEEENPLKEFLNC